MSRSPVNPRRSAPAVSVVAPVLIVALAGCGDGTPPAAGGAAGPPGKVREIFRDVTGEVGVDFVHFTGATGGYAFPEIMGAGVALIDYDGDGDLDLYLIQGGMVMPGASIEQALFPPRQAPPLRNRLYRNDLCPGPGGTRRLAFTDVTAETGAGDTGYGMGCAVGDYDNDGDSDLYVTNYGSNVLYRNDGGRFTDVTAAAGADEPRWSTSASFFDYDRDGVLDLAVVNYVAFAEDVQRACRRPAGDRDYCTPLAYRPLPDTLFHGNGDGTFTDVTAAAGLAGTFGNGLGVIAADMDRDGWTDLYVANDGMANQLWMNRGDGTFVDRALLAGVALNASGDAEAGMGVTVGDYDADGDEDIFVVHLYGETNTLYVNQGHGVFDDLTFRFALGSVSRNMTGFGTGFLDYDNDGVEDIVVVNGAVTKVDTQIGDPYPYRMPNQLFRGTAGGGFQDVSARAGAAFSRLESSRGAAIGDLDLDGDEDLVITNNNGPARVLRNDAGDAGHWLGVAVRPARGNRDGYGTMVELRRAGGGRALGRAHADGSYCSSGDAHVHFGLGGEDGPVELTVRWPDGRRERWSGVAVDATVTLREGEGEPAP